MQKILITGSTGFIGNKISLHLAKKNKIFNFDRRIAKKNNKNIKSYIYPKKIEQYVSFLKKNKIDLIIHTAGYFAKKNNNSDIDKLIDVDLKKTLYLLEAAKLSDVRNFISLGTAWQFAKLNNHYYPVNLYASTKQCINIIAEHFSVNCGMKHLQLIIFDTFGENDKRKKIINTLIKMKKNSKFIITDPHNIFFPIYIADLCRGIDSSIKYMYSKNEPFNKQYCIKPTKGLKIYELVNIISKLRKIKFSKIIYLNNKKNKKLLFKNKIPILPNWKPKYNLSEGLRKLIKF